MNTLPSTSDSSSTQESSHTKSSLQPSLEKDVSSESAISDDQNEDDDGAVRATQHIHGVGIGGGPGGGGGGGGGGGSDVRFGRKTSVNAKSQDITIADGEDTQGIINRHPAASELENAAFQIGVSEDRNKKCRRTMEDSHAFIYDFGGVKGQGYFAVFDGHAGKHAAEWCGAHFHEYLLEQLRDSPTTPVPDLLNSTFHLADSKLSQLAAEDGTHSGCTAVTAFLRLEDENGNAVMDVKGSSSSGSKKDSESTVGEHNQMDVEESASGESEGGEGKKRGFREGLRSFMGVGSGGGGGSSGSLATTAAATGSGNGPKDVKAAKKTLYTANVGDARAVLSRGGKAVRLTYDHKGSDAQEAKRITDAGGFVMNNRVNGVLAVTRSLGDSSMKEFVVGSPYTTETTLGDDDEFLIIACDGLWDVCEDQQAVDLVKDIKEPQQASRILLDHALSAFSTDNLSVLVVRLNHS